MLLPYSEKNSSPIDKSHLEEILSQGYYFEENREYDQAINLYRQYLLLDPENPWANAHLAECLSAIGMHAEAFDYFSKSIQLDPQYTWALSHRGDLYFYTEKFQLALEDYQAALLLNFDDLWLLNQIGECMVQLRHFDEAVMAFNQSLGLKPDQAWTLSHRAWAQIELGRFGEARLDIEESLKLEPQKSWTYFIRGVYSLKQGNKGNALADYNKAISLEPDVSSYYKERGLFYQETGEYQKAVDDFNDLINLVPQEAEYYLLKVFALNALDDKKEAIKTCQEAIHYGLKNEHIFTELGILLIEENQHAKAIPPLSRAIELNPYNFEAWVNRAEAFRYLGQTKRALADLNKALKIDHYDDPWIYNVRGLIHEEMEEDLKALSDFAKAIELDASYSNAYKNRAALLTRLGRHAEAARDLETALQLNPHDPWALDKRGALFEKTGRFEEAEKDYLAVIELDARFYETSIKLLKMWSGEDQSRRGTQVLEDLLDSQPDNNELRANIAWAFEKNLLFQKALVQYDLLLHYLPQNPDYMLRRAVVKKNLFLVNEALQDLDDVLQLDPKNPDVYAYIGQTYRVLCQHDKAIKNYNQSLKLKKKQAWVIANRGLAYFLQKDMSAALVDYQEAYKLGYQNAWLYERLADVCLLSGQYTETIDWAKRASQENGNNPWPYYQRGLAYQKLGQEHSSRKYLDMALKQAKEQKYKPEFDLRCGFNLALITLSAGYDTEALEDYQTLLKQQPPGILVREILQSDISSLKELLGNIRGLAKVSRLLTDYLSNL